MSEHNIEGYLDGHYYLFSYSPAIHGGELWAMWRGTKRTVYRVTQEQWRDLRAALTENRILELMEGTMSTEYKCPECGAVMRQVRRGATLRKRGPAYICPRAEGAFPKDQEGRFVHVEGDQHRDLRIWSPQELDKVDRQYAFFAEAQKRLERGDV